MPRRTLEGASTVAAHAAAIRDRIAAAARRAGRAPEGVELVGVSKGQPVERVCQAFAAGVRIFGESRVQEALLKIEQVPAEAEWHFVGPLQTNKARPAAAAFAVIHSVDRLRLAEALDREAERLGRPIACFLEVNVGAEASKHGFLEQEIPEALPRLAALDGLRILGLMCVPPEGADAEASRPWFRMLRRLRDRVAATGLLTSFRGALSMGMSNDFEIAVEEGATHVRVGTALFGPRLLPRPVVA